MVSFHAWKRSAVPLGLTCLLAGPLAAGPARAQEKTVEIEEAEEAQEAEPAEVPAAPPDFGLRTPKGGEVLLSKLRKQVTVLFAWTPDCAECLGQLPHLSALQLKLKGDPKVSVLALAAVPGEDPKDRQPVIEAARAHKLAVPVVLDEASGLTSWLLDAARGEDDRQVHWVLPLLVVADKDMHVYHIWGLAADTPKERWVAEVLRIVALAKQGQLPESPPIPAGLAAEDQPAEGPPGEAVPAEGAGGESAGVEEGPERAAFPFPKKLSRGEIDERLPIYRGFLQERYSRLTKEQLDALMAEFSKQLEEGRTEVVLEIPAGVTEAKGAP
ncbi:MAG TPA: TlpA disulfide reductase family protein [Myxococcota bacterium]|nr:TlpA disulfide reductase family protein [Myxococcota bacterium]HRY93044.1 TlpA disulfide reductase family protein [Myxococcota bacterium]HSA21582.1 TlpA disulfide reductase family protein [Myxococcota bacterium]